jgi:hypothetical protein
VKGKVMRRAMEHSENLDRQLIDGVKVFENGNSVLILPTKNGPNLLSLPKATMRAMQKTLPRFIKSISVSGKKCKNLFLKSNTSCNQL